jgi:flagella basal body P-ring formation protein FlgA
MTTFRTILALTAGVAVIAGAAAADSITLKRSVRRVGIDQPVRLRDIATIDGPHASRFASLEIAPAASLPADGVATIDVADVRTALDAAGVSWGEVDLSGGRVTLRPAIDVGAGEADPATDAPGRRFRTQTSDRGDHGVMDGAGANAGFDRVADLIDAADADALSATIARLVLEDVLEVEPDPRRVLVRLDRSAVADLPETATDCRVRLRGRGDTDRVIAEVSGRLPDGRRPQCLVPVEVRLERRVPVAARRITRGQRLLGAGADLEVAWRSFAISEVVGETATLLEPRSVVGRELATTVEPGEAVVRAMLVPEIVVRRGMRVRVRSVAGGYEMIRDMEALEDGAVGDRIPCGEIGASRGSRRGAGVDSSSRIMAIVIDDRGTLEVR